MLIVPFGQYSMGEDAFMRPFWSLQKETLCLE